MKGTRSWNLYTQRFPGRFWAWQWRCCDRRGGQQKQEKSRQDYSGEGMCLGMGLGVALVTALDGTEHLGLGLSLGMLAGMAIGACVEKPHP